jgi:hypothetical protein
MDAISFLSDLLKLTLAGLAVFFVAWHFIKDYLDSIQNKRANELKKSAQQHLFPLRLQAYERLVLFLERINPTAMLVRLHVSGVSAREMQNIILSDIRSEYQHNISQQLYVSNQAWAIVRKIKEDTIGMVNSAAQGLPENAAGVELSKVILNHLASVDDKNPYEAALVLIKQDIQQLF